MRRAADWIVAVPLKPAGSRKTRLASRLDAHARDALAEAMAAHVLATVGRAGGRAVALAAACPPGWKGAWHRDAGGGLNAALAGMRAAWRDRPFAVIHADLPHLMPDDVSALLEAGAGGLALAPDARGAGTNALALPPGRPIDFRFGAGSLALFRSQAAATLVRRPGIARDLDTPADLARAPAFLRATMLRDAPAGPSLFGASSVTERQS